MGYWGVGIYSNDVAEDVKDQCEQIFAVLNPEEGTQRIININRDLISIKEPDIEQASFWYALADWQWKHNILQPSVKQKAEEMFRLNVGIEEWGEVGSSTQKKRRAILEKLMASLAEPSPLKKIKRANLAPRHRVGDLLAVYFPPNQDAEYKEITHHIVLKTEGQPREFRGMLDASGKYILLLCVGSRAEPYSQYLDDIFCSNAIYALYDYYSSELPDKKAISELGFLPMYYEKPIIPKMGVAQFLGYDTVAWVYSTTMTPSGSKYFDCNIKIKRIANTASEVKRFHDIIQPFATTLGETFCFTDVAEHIGNAEMLRKEGFSLYTGKEGNFNPELPTPSERYQYYTYVCDKKISK